MIERDFDALQRELFASRKAERLIREELITLREQQAQAQVVARAQLEQLTQRYMEAMIRREDAINTKQAEVDTMSKLLALAQDEVQDAALQRYKLRERMELAEEEQARMTHKLCEVLESAKGLDGVLTP